MLFGSVSYLGWTWAGLGNKYWLGTWTLIICY